MRFFIVFCLTFLCTVSAYADDKIVIDTKTGKTTISAEIADTPEKRRIGLMFRQYLPENNGMLFLFGENRDIAMWMKNTYLSLDMLFIDETGVIKCIIKNAEPLSLVPVSCHEKTAAVLEINAGQAVQRGIFAGDKVTHNAFKNK